MKSFTTRNEKKLEIKYEPFQEIIVKERNLFSSVEDLARFASIAAGGHTASLYWAKEVIFLYYPLPTSTDTAARAVVERGTLYWIFVGYALMKTYQPMIETKEKIMVPVINMSANSRLRQVAEWLICKCYDEDRQ